MDMHSLLTGLNRPAFTSEDDFKFALAWEIKTNHPEAEVFLEYPIKANSNNKNIYIDIVVKIHNEYIPIELKYKTDTDSFEHHDGNIINLKYQSAHDNGRYDFIRDISRIETLLFDDPMFNSHGYAILLTNDSVYWDKGREKKEDSNDRDFKIFHNTAITGTRCWYYGDVKAVEQGERGKALHIQGNYIMDWRDYSPQECKTHRRFKYVLVRIAKPKCE